MKQSIATILKAQGIKGEVKMASLFDNAFLLSLKTVFIDSKTYQVKKIRSDGKFLYILLDGVNDRNQAEELRGKTVFANKEDIVLPQDTFFVDDLLGCMVVDTLDNVLGELVDIYKNGISADVYVLKNDRGDKISFPFIKKLNAKFDKDANKLTVDDKIISQIVLYEKEN
ncbi:MAG: 16S rRNA processing protein RimM [Clostridia bacterium]|nr:16S rRNA processing protein RimM [Clostridia bacterium]